MLRALIQFLFVWVCSAAVAQTTSDFEHGPRPPGGVYDPAGLIDATALEEISAPLAALRSREGVDVVVVVLPEIGDAPPEHVAGQFAAAWCSSRIHAVVLHVPGQEKSPWIVPGGELLGAIQPGKFRETVREATSRAVREPTEVGKVRAASVEAADMLRYWLGTAINRSEHLRTERTKLTLDRETKARQRRILGMVVAASAIPLLVALGMTVAFFRKPGPRRFPDAPVPTRLGAPFCGGNHALINLGNPILPKSR